MQMKTLPIAAVLVLITTSACKGDDAATGAGGSAATTDASSTSTGGGGPCFGTTSDDPEFAQALQVLRDTLAVEGVPGGAIAVIENESLVNVGVSGTKRAGVCEPVTLDTLFGASYISEILTGIAALDAVEDGELSLTAPITGVVGPLKIDHGAAYADDITLHHLLTHSSTYTSAADAQPQQSTCTTIAGAFATPVNAIIEGPPGSLSDSADRANSELAALALELVDKKPFRDIVADRVLTPLGMGGTFDVGQVAASDHATGYSAGGVELSTFDCPNHDASYGYYGSIRDLAKLGAFLAAGGPVLDPSTFAAMNAEQGPDFYSDSYTTYVMTGWRAEPIGERFQEKSGGVGSGFAEYLISFPDRGLVVMVVLNAETGYDVTLRAALDIAKIYGVNPAVDAWQDAEAYTPDPSTLPSFVGTYVDDVGVNGTGPRTLVVTQDAGGIAGTLSDMNGNAQPISFVGNYCADNFKTGANQLVRFWRKPSEDPYAVQFLEYANGPAFFRVP